MRLSETWKRNLAGGYTCIWCYRDAYECDEDRCGGRREWERIHRPQDADK